MRAFLGDISEIQVGYQSREGIRAQSNGSHFLLQARDFDNLHQVDWSNLTRFTPAGSTTKSEIQPGDVLFLAKGQDNFACPVNSVTNLVLAANSFYIVRLDQGMILPELLCGCLIEPPGQVFRQNHSLIKRSSN